MSDSDSDWLELREKHDHATRSVELTTGFASALDADACIIDLGCGTGSNYRYLGAKLGTEPRWLCVDHDPKVLASAAARLSDPKVRFQRTDLSRELSSLLPLEPGTAITLSAFLDMTSAAWLLELAVLCRDTPLLAAMSFDGRVEWLPAAPLDESIRLQWLAKRLGDQGFGPSLCHDAAAFLAEQLRQSGHRVVVETSDWQLGANDPALLQMMVGGIARRVDPAASDSQIARWRELRTGQIEAGKLRLMLGHVDLLSLPVA